MHIKLSGHDSAARVRMICKGVRKQVAADNKRGALTLIITLRPIWNSAERARS
jgi:hypothetical protein